MTDVARFAHAPLPLPTNHSRLFLPLSRWRLISLGKLAVLDTIAISFVPPSRKMVVICAVWLYSPVASVSPFFSFSSLLYSALGDVMDRSPITLLTDLITKEAELGGFDPYTYTYLLGKRCGAVLLSEFGLGLTQLSSASNIHTASLHQ